jgi:hypothetical protein
MVSHEIESKSSSYGVMIRAQQAKFDQKLKPHSIRSTRAIKGVLSRPFCRVVKKTIKFNLGCIFRRNSGRSSCSVPDSGVFWLGMFKLRFRRSGSFSLTHFHTSANSNVPPLRSRPNTNTFGEGLSIFFEPLHLKEKPILRKFNLSCVQVEEKMIETETALLELWASFRVLTEFRPMSDRNRDGNLRPRIQLFSDKNCTSSQIVLNCCPTKQL